MVVQDAHFTWDDDPAQSEPFLICDRCGMKLCTVEEGDSLSVIVAVADDHWNNNASECDGHARSPCARD